MIQLIQQSVLLIGTLAGAITDAKTGYIYDWITYPLLLIGFILAIIGQQWNNLILACVVLGVLFLSYKLGKIGGGDVKLFGGIALLNPFNDYLFFATVILFAAMSAMMFFSIFYTIKYARSGINYAENKKGIQKAILFGVIILTYFGALINFNLLTIASATLIGTPLFFGLIFLAFQKGITKNFFEKKINLSQIEEDEVLSKESNSEKVFELLAGKALIGKNEKKLLEKHKIKTIYVIRQLPPFGPFIFLGIVGALISPQFFLLLFM